MALFLTVRCGDWGVEEEEVWECTEKRKGGAERAVKMGLGGVWGGGNEGVIWEPSVRRLQGFLSKTSPSGGTQVLEAE